MSRFYVPCDAIHKDVIYIRGCEAHHARDVMRVKVSDDIIVFDGSGKEYFCVIDKIGKNDIIAKVNKTIKRKVDNFRLALAQAMPKLNKMDFVIERATELGVERIIPMITERAIIKTEAGKAVPRVNRWKKLAIEASKQCGRVTVPEINDIENYKDSLSHIKNYELAIIPTLCEGTLRLKEILKNKIVKSAIIFIGPEGDFTEGEINLAKSKGAEAVSLGRKVLRAETAAITALSILNYELRW